MKQIIVTFLIIFVGIGAILKNDYKNEKVRITFIREESPIEGVSDERQEDGGVPNNHPNTKANNEQRNPSVQTPKKVEIFAENTKAATIAMVREVADQFNIPQETLLCVFNRESGVQSHDPKTGELKCGDNGQSCGLGQIKIGTWRSIRKHAGWDISDLRWDDKENIMTTAYGMTHGWQEHWTGFRDCRDMGYKLR